MIQAKNIYFSYDKSEKFIDSLNLQIEKGKITTILGPNGSGKSTVLSLLCGLNKIKSGEIFIEDKNINKQKYKDIAKTIATVHQQNSVPNDITVESLVGFGRLPYKRPFEKVNKEDEYIIKWAINSTGLSEYKNKAVMSMSGGERQRAFISMALAQKTEILFLDEPTTYLDIYHQIEILEIVKKLNEENGTTIVMVLHDINQAIKYSDNIVVMRSGEIIKTGKAEEVINKKLIQDVYGVSGVMNKCKVSNETFFVATGI